MNHQKIFEFAAQEDEPIGNQKRLPVIIREVKDNNLTCERCKKRLVAVVTHGPKRSRSVLYTNDGQRHFKNRCNIEEEKTCQ